MADRPILFSAPMVRALLAGTKTQTRRLNGVPAIEQTSTGWWHVKGRAGGTLCRDEADVGELAKDYLPIQPGDRLWVRESYFQRGRWEPVHGAVTRKGGRQKWRFVPDDDVIQFEAPPIYRKGRHPDDLATPAWHKRLGRFMPRAASRLTLIVTDVRVQRVRDITLGDICAEGLASSIYDFKPVQRGFDAWLELWDSINGAGSWDANPWVAAYTFVVHQQNIDAMEKAA
ncbi:hypothetical protein [Ancylobacter radicis]|uniref:ASCH domain-containing protein n=1 Tax=Ancylobacter radicis TaxID=2836179 RepID=A0ABS5R4Q0_9HYPH|nr:hypothetical protein [Ancylobacter radicis]MBS9476180.1 hypothetical protein [Ancylobacter radicis]